MARSKLNGEYPTAAPDWSNLSRGTTRLARLFGDIIEGSSAGTYITSRQGRQYLNCGGYGTFFVGARHPTVVAAVKAQIDRHPLSSRLFLEPALAQAAGSLARVAPQGLRKIFFTASGAEAVEAAMKLARLHGRTRVISMERGYHGKTLGALSLTANPTYQRPFVPLIPDVYHVPFNNLPALARCIGDEGSTTCVFIEPIQSEAGVILPEQNYLRGVSELCNQAGALLIADEIMTGLGRTGFMWYSNGAGMSADIVLAGKALTGGVVPVAALIASPSAFEPFDNDPYIHTSTFSGAPIAAAAASAAIQVIEEEGLVRRAYEIGNRLIPQLQDIAKRTAPWLIREIRGEGVLIGIETISPSELGEFILHMVEHGVIVNNSLNAHPVARLTPPATLSGGDEEWLLGAFEASLVAMSNGCTHD